jgi:hypothetical protein
MKYTIENSSDLEITKVTIDGRLTLLERKKIYSKAISELKRNGYKRLLFDGSKAILSSGYTDEESVEMSNYMKEFEVQRNTKLVFLSREIFLTQTTFLAIAKVINEDLDIRHFTNYDNAIKWLCQQVSVKVPLFSNISRFLSNVKITAVYK